ncbi:hypothetical protein [Pseudodesulfovibrio indicus]|uniref:hypothetical protein n=1 Tax=Pseudodesulfovibrio indicus TaxID=1716143 RepID=UPI00292E23EB|nr:hypothetical protein [Pseudodesulfovibrio indicus]
MSSGSNISNIAGRNTTGGQTATKQTMGAPTTAPTTSTVPPKEDQLTKHPVPTTPRLTGVFGPMGIGAIKETEEAFSSGGILEGKRGEISVPDNFSWSFKEGKPVGNAPTWSPNRGEGALRDKVAEVVGNGYDRTVTSERAKDILARGKGALSTWTEGLAEGNYQYDEQGKPAPDKIGLAYDFVKPLFGLATSGPLSAIWGGANAIDTAMDHNRLQAAGIFGTTQPRAQRRSPVGNPRATDAVAAMLGNDDSGNHSLASRMTASLTKGKAQKESKQASAQRTAKPITPRTRGSLILTGPRGIQDQPDVMLRRLFGV